MPNRKRLALFAGQIEETRQSAFVNGFLLKTFAMDYDVCIFSMYRKYQDTEIRETAEINIFNLFNPDLFDGVVILKDSIQTSESTIALEKKLHEIYSGPVLMIDRESEFFPSVYEDDYLAMCEIVDHMIDEHGYKDIAFVSGKKWHHHAVSRLQAFNDTMKKHGIDIAHERIFNGDFWYTSGLQAVKFFDQSPLGMPEAIICANDEMAIGVLDALDMMNIKVPDQVAVAGFDSFEEGQLSPMSITSSVIPYESIGEYGAYYIDCRLKGIEPEPFDVKAVFRSGETCGCKACDFSSYIPKRKRWETVRMEEGFNDINNMLSRNLLVQSDLEGFFGTVYSYAYQIKEVRRFALCIAQSWIDDESDYSLHETNEGYPSRMCLAVDYNVSDDNGDISLDRTFETSSIFPGLYDDRETPVAYIFTPFFFEAECFGYAIVSYGDHPHAYDSEYRIWIEMVADKFESLRRIMGLQAYKTKFEQMRTNKFSAKGYRYETLNPEEKKECDLTRKILDENLLSYVYQPIVRASDGEIFSYEALMRTSTEQKLSPLQIIKYANIMDRLSDIENATFMNILSQICDDEQAFFGRKIFINSIPGIILDNEKMEKISDLMAKQYSKIVVELTEESELKDDDVQRIKTLFSSLGVELAIDDYGTGYSNINNLLRYIPNYVKIDRSLLGDIDSKPQKQHFVNEIISFCKDNNILSLAEGVETQAELRTVIHMGVDLLQGYYLAKPAAVPLARLDSKISNEIAIYSHEKEDGVEKQVYLAGSSNRITLGLLVKYGCTDIVVGKEDAVYRDVSIIGAPNMNTDINLKIMSGYNGEITLENVSLSNVKGRPCIDVCEGADVIIKLNGNNTLRGMGIRVHKNSRLTLQGEGNLTVSTNDAQYYGIGNDLESEHGTIIFDQDGKVTINGNGHEGVCIGSGLGGEITVRRGLYDIKAGGTKCVGIGSFTSESYIEIVNCCIEEDINANLGVGIGTMDSISRVSISKASVKVHGGGNKMSGIGSLNGEYSSVKIEDSSVDLIIRSNLSTCLGTVNGKTDIEFAFVGIRLDNSGKSALAFGGVECETSITLENTDSKVELHNVLDRETYAPDDKITIKNGRIMVVVNDQEIRRILTYS